MSTLSERMLGAAKLDVHVYEEVEHDTAGTSQAAVVVVLSSIAGGIGATGMGGGIVAGTIAALLLWVIWAFLTYFIGTRLLPEPQTHADIGQMMRTLGFAQSPGLLRVLGGVPVLGQLLLAIVSVWMLVAMVIAVRQALDYSSTPRAIGVCVVSWIVALIPSLVVLGMFGGGPPS